MNELLTQIHYDLLVIVFGLGALIGIIIMKR